MPAGLTPIALALWIVTSGVASTALAQEPAKPQDGPTVVAGTPSPIPPKTVSRDEGGHLTVRATRLAHPIHVDGRLDEGVYGSVPPMSDFIQTEPDEGSPATERTEAWIFFNGRNLYISGKCYDSASPDRWILNELRHDSTNIVLNEVFAIVLDTFHDRRNAVSFQITPLGAIFDAQITNETGPQNWDWNPVWEAKAGRFDGGWTFEMEIPFRSLRYRPGTEQTWGVNMRRRVQWKHEESFLAPVVRTGQQGIFQISRAATLVGLEAPPGSRNIEITPYGISRLLTDRLANPALSNDFDADVGLDAKYGVTQNITADFTVNTDFAQVEVDEQQVNLTRFGLFFPEKRGFFLEGSGIFNFGIASGVGGFTGDVPTLFFSRRIGLSGNRAVPIVAGGRMTGKVDRYTLGLLTIQTADAPQAGAPPTNFAVVRASRDILRRSAIGVMFTNRSRSTIAAGSNQVYGLDARFAFFNTLSLQSYVARTRTNGLEEDLSYRTHLDYAGDLFGVQLERLVVGEEFNPEVGFVSRSDMRKYSSVLRYSPRPESIESIRKLLFEGRFNYIENNAGVLETRNGDAVFGIDFENTDLFRLSYSREHELVAQPFRISGATIPIGTYDFQNLSMSYTLGASRRTPIAVRLERGSFYNGSKTTVAVTGARVRLTYRLGMEPGITIHRIELPQERFPTALVQNRIILTMTPRMFLAGLLQYNSTDKRVSANFRLRWEYSPGSELFVVYTEERDAAVRGFPEPQNRAFVVKMNRLFRF